MYKPVRKKFGGPAGSRPRFRKPFPRRKVCRFCADKMDYIDFKNANLLRNFISDRGKMLSSRSTGVCAYHQRGLMRAIKRARNIALIPFSVI
ncbi:MAG: 30S ribosomal protein S18 [Elusimicrobia bacterium]|nr:30S ribosomal protein S18 [Elusimicrobiota bacterium]MBI3013140.1 30S ribosomal protein S18 [Elusimicrobiota bacterium]MBI4217699.1 30S ribosomal protein S18 [Elusimicrobiota bacterium]